MPEEMSRRLRIAMAAGLAGALLAGCGGATKTVTVDTGHGAATTGGPPTTTTTAPPSTGPTQPAPAPTGPPLASAHSTWDGRPVSLDIVSLARSGAVANLTVRLTNNDQAGGSNRLGVQVAQLFGTYRGPVQLIDSMAGIALIDAADNKKYPVAKDTSGACVCDANLASTFVAAGQSVMLSASFAAPPPNVSRVDVLVPHFGTSHQVPIS